MRELLTACPLCQGKTFEKWLLSKDFAISQEEFHIVSCKQCAFKFLNPRPSQKEIGRYYDSQRYLSHQSEKKDLVAQLYDWVKNHITLPQKYRWIKKYSSKEVGSLLDVGCGNGSFLRYMQNKGWQCSGIEPHTPALQFVQDKSHIYPSFNEIEKKNIKFDVITLWHVLEHVHELDFYMNKLYELISEKGKIFIAVPNPASYDSQYYKEFWAAWDPPRHLYHFTAYHMHNLCWKHGLRIQTSIGMPFDAYYIALLSSEYKYGRKKWLSAFLQASISNWKALRNKQYSSLLYIIDKIN